MILNENYFDDLKLTDEVIESSESNAPSSYNKYATPEDWFMDMNSNIREKLFTDDNALLNKMLRCF